MGCGRLPDGVGNQRQVAPEFAPETGRDRVAQRVHGFVYVGTALTRAAFRRWVRELVEHLDAAGSLFAVSGSGGERRAVVLAGVCSDRARRDTDAALEGAAECGLGPVAEPVGELADGGALLLQAAATCLRQRRRISATPAGASSASRVTRDGSLTALGTDEIAAGPRLVIARSRFRTWQALPVRGEPGRRDDRRPRDRLPRRRRRLTHRSRALRGPRGPPAQPRADTPSFEHNRGRGRRRVPAHSPRP